MPRGPPPPPTRAAPSPSHARRFRRLLPRNVRMPEDFLGIDLEVVEQARQQPVERLLLRRRDRFVLVVVRSGARLRRRRADELDADRVRVARIAVGPRLGRFDPPDLLAGPL